MTLAEIACINCGRSYPEDGTPSLCPNCGGIFDYRSPFPFQQDLIDPTQPGIWKYRHAFGLADEVDAVSLGEGNTPLVWTDVFGRHVGFKCEYMNPSGSFKDRGSTVIATWLRDRGVTAAVEDSSGNAGASFAAFAARAGIRAQIFAPESAAGPKRRQIEAYGAELVTIPGTRSDVTEAAKREAERGKAYASHAALPFNLAGYATAAYEIYAQMGRMPGTVIVPAGQGGFLLGIARGFDALRIANSLSETPRIVGVQARACAPLWAAFTGGRQAMALMTENQTLAEGVRVRHPLRGDAVLKAIRDSHGNICGVDENEILPARDDLARLGFYVEPTSALVWAALRQDIDQYPDPIILILTGSGLKYG